MEGVNERLRMVSLLAEGRHQLRDALHAAKFERTPARSRPCKAVLNAQKSAKSPATSARGTGQATFNVFTDISRARPSSTSCN
eukprot:3761193-Pleurochrysis_carterae.AAC.5